MNLWPTNYVPELYAGLLLDQNCERDVFNVWVGDDKEMSRLAKAFESIYKCTVIHEYPGMLTVCCPEADSFTN